MLVQKLSLWADFFSYYNRCGASVMWLAVKRGLQIRPPDATFSPRRINLFAEN